MQGVRGKPHRRVTRGGEPEGYIQKDDWPRCTAHTRTVCYLDLEGASAYAHRGRHRGPQVRFAPSVPRSVAARVAVGGERGCAPPGVAARGPARHWGCERARALLLYSNAQQCGPRRARASRVPCFRFRALRASS
eukprot:5148227-Prymnesium_polylepis.1